MSSKKATILQHLRKMCNTLHVSLSFNMCLFQSRFVALSSKIFFFRQKKKKSVLFEVSLKKLWTSIPQKSNLVNNFMALFATKWTGKLLAF